MSVEVESSLLHKPRKHRKSEGDEKGEIKKKKHKRHEAEGESELAAPKKKKHKSQSSDTRLKPETPVQSAPGPIPTSQNSPFYTQLFSLYLPIAPIAQSHPLAALCAEHISPLLLSYYPPFHGVLISYSNARLSSSPNDALAEKDRPKAFARSVDEYAATFVWLIADFLVLRPQRGDVIEGYVNLQSESSISLLYWNFFNASIERRRIPKEWKWRPGGSKSRVTPRPKQNGSAKIDAKHEMAVDDEEGGAQQNGVDDDLGCWLDENGMRINGLVRFYVHGVETSRSADRDNGFLGIEGSIVELAEDQVQPWAGRVTNGSIFGGASI